jgi:hypothetical protein
MQSYIFFTPNINNLGGAEIYVSNKANWLSMNGYRVVIISTKKGDILLKDLYKHRESIITELAWPPHFYCKFRRELIINKIIKIIGETKEASIIESNSILISPWGEIVANHLNSKHIVFSLQEINSTKFKDLFYFVDFKNKRGELAGIKQESFKNIFKNTWNKTRVLVAYQDNSPKDIKCEIKEKIRPADFTIASIGRLEKPYVIPILKDVVNYVKQKQDYKFNFLFIGGTDHSVQLNRIKKIVKGTDNLKLYITGFIYPVPISLIMVPDLFISSAGSCRMSAMHGKLTISIDTNDFKPIGIFGVNTNNTIHRVNEEKVELENLIDDILMKNLYKSSEFKYNVDPIEPNYQDHINFINNSRKSKDYYQFDFDSDISPIIKGVITFFSPSIVKLAITLKKLFQA